MDALLRDPCCLLGIVAAGLVAVFAAGAALVRGAQILAARLAPKRTKEPIIEQLNSGGVHVQR